MARDELTAPATPGSLVVRAGAEDYAEFPPGTPVGDWMLGSRIAAGGCGTVYSARHRTSGSSAAIKILHREFIASGEMITRFQREAQVVGQIRHPGLVEALGSGELPDGRPYIAMELLEGETLRGLIERRGRLSPREALAFLTPVCEALTAAHEAGFVHRDVKASNVAVLSEAEPPVVRLLDFGVAKLLRPAAGERGLTAVGQRIGTPTAMAPEQIRGETIDARADVYALGVLLHQLLTGRLPFRSHDPVELEHQHLASPPPRPGLLAPVAPEVDAVVLRCMEKLPSQRYPTVQAFLAALRSATSLQRARPELLPLRSCPSVAVYLEVRLAPLAEEDDEALAQLSRLLDAAEEALRGEEYSLYLTTGSALLAVLPLADDPSLERAQRRAALTLAQQLAELPAREGAGAVVSVQVQVHRGEAALRGPEVCGGPVTAIEDWLQETSAAFCATEAACAGLEGSC